MQCVYLSIHLCMCVCAHVCPHMHTHTHANHTPTLHSTGQGGDIPKEQPQKPFPRIQRENLAARCLVHHPRPRPTPRYFSSARGMASRGVGANFLCVDTFKIFSTKLPAKCFHLRHLQVPCNSCSHIQSTRCWDSIHL